MPDTLSIRFQKTNGAPIDLDGQEVRPSLRLPLEKGVYRYRIHRIKAKSAPLQGLRIKIKKGEITLNGQALIDVALWADTSPGIVELEVNAKVGCELVIWNSWRAGDLMQAWVGNAGLTVEGGDSLTTLACSDGTGSVDFSDLVVQIERIV